MKLHHRLQSIFRLFQEPRGNRKTQTECIQLSLQQMEQRQVLSVAGGEALLFSTGGNEEFPNAVQAEPADIVQYDGSEFAILFDGSDVGLDGANIDALAIVGDNQLLLSFSSDVNIAGLGNIGSGDVVLFQADSLGEDTAGTFSLFASGAELGLNPADNIDALDLLDDGSLVVSTLRNTTLSSGPDGGTFSANDEDLIQITPDEFGNFSTGTRQIFLDGSDVGLSFSNENIDGISINDLEIRLSTFRGNSVSTSVAGSAEDVLTFTATQFGEETQGSYVGITFNGGDEAGFGFDLNAFDYANLSTPSTPPTAENLAVEVVEDQSLQIQLQGDDGDLDVENTLTFQIVDGPNFGGISGFDPETGTLTYTGAENFHGEDQFTYLVQEVDGNGVVLNSEVAVVQIHVTAVNDAPVVTLPQGPLTGNEDVPIQISGILVGDVEAESQQKPVAVTLRGENGIVSLEGSQAGVQIVGNGTNEITLTGSVSEINSLLAQGVMFRPDTNFSGQAGLEVSIEDDLNPDSSLSASGRVEIEILSTREQASAFRDQVFELLESGELGRRTARRLLNAVKFNGHGRQLDRTLNRIDRWAAKGRISSELAQQLTEQLEDLRDGATTGRFEKLDNVFSRIGKVKFPKSFARWRCR